MISIIIVNSLNWFQLFIWNLGKDKDLIVLLQYIFTILTEADYLVHITFQALFCIFSIYRCAAKSLQSCPTLCDPIDSSPPGPHPWDSPGKNTGVGCHFLLQCMKVKSESEVAQSVWLLVTPWTAAFRLLHPWDFPGKSTGVGCHCLLRFIGVE